MDYRPFPQVKRKWAPDMSIGWALFWLGMFSGMIPLAVIFIIGELFGV